MAGYWVDGNTFEFLGYSAYDNQFDVEVYSPPNDEDRLGSNYYDEYTDQFTAYFETNSLFGSRIRCQTRKTTYTVRAQLRFGSNGCQEMNPPPGKGTIETGTSWQRFRTPMAKARGANTPPDNPSSLQPQGFLPCRHESKHRGSKGKCLSDGKIVPHYHLYGAPPENEGFYCLFRDEMFPIDLPDGDNI